MKKKAISILIADDQEIIRHGLKRIISFEDDMEIVYEAENGEKAEKFLEKNNVDVALLDRNMPVVDGIHALMDIKKQYEKVKVIILTVEADRDMINKAINIGVDGYILKDSAGEEIVSAIRAVHSGKKYIDKSLVSVLFSDIKIKSKKDASILDKLSKREIEVLIRISKGLSNKEIGKELFISEKTVKNYATNVFRKIDTDDRVKAAIFAIENDIERYYIDKWGL